MRTHFAVICDFDVLLFNTWPSLGGALFGNIATYNLLDTLVHFTHNLIYIKYLTYTSLDFCDFPLLYGPVRLDSRYNIVDP